MSEAQIGNPYVVLTAVELLFTLAEQALYTEHGRTQSPLLCALNNRIMAVQERLGDPAQPDHNGLLDELKRLQRQAEAEHSHVRAEWARMHPEPDIAVDQIEPATVAVVRRARECIASSLANALAHNADHLRASTVIAAEALRCMALGWPIDLNMHSLTPLLPSDPGGENARLELQDKARLLIKDLEERDSTAQSMVEAIQRDNDMTELCKRMIAGTRPELWAGEFQALVRTTRNILLGIVPDAMSGDPTDHQQSIINELYELANRLSPGIGEVSYSMTVTDLEQLPSKYPSVLAASVRGFPDFRFESESRATVFNADKKEACQAMDMGLVKCVCVMCGAMLESLLVEFLCRHPERLKTVLADNKEKVLGKNPPHQCKSDDPRTWTLDPIIKASALMADDKKLAEMWRDLQQSRNAIHGRVVSQSAARFAMGTVIQTAEMLAEDR